jgi:hypothetical protein
LHPLYHSYVELVEASRVFLVQLSICIFARIASTRHVCKISLRSEHGLGAGANWGFCHPQVTLYSEVSISNRRDNLLFFSRRCDRFPTSIVRTSIVAYVGVHSRSVASRNPFDPRSQVTTAIVRSCLACCLSAGPSSSSFKTTTRLSATLSYRVAILSPVIPVLGGPLFTSPGATAVSSA